MYQLNDGIIVRGSLVLSDRVEKDGVVFVRGDRIEYAGSLLDFKTNYPNFLDIFSDGIGNKIREIKKIPFRVKDILVFDYMDNYVVPALVEMHLHGAGGYDFETPEKEKRQSERERELLAFADFISSHGVGVFLPTFVFNEEILKSFVDTLRTIYEGNSILRDRIPGIYIEGPFISREKRGGIQEDYISCFSKEYFEHIYSVTMGFLRVMTFAPEIDGANRLLSTMQRHRVMPSLGHSNCTVEDLERLDLEKLDIINVTHLFNGMSGVSHKKPGLAHWALLNDSVYTELNCDETHVHPLALRLAFKMHSTERIILISDAISPAGLNSSGDYSLRGRRVYVRGNGVYDAQTDTLVGSRLLVKDSISRLTKDYSLPLIDVIKMVSLNPLKLLGIPDRGVLREGMKADISVFDRDFNRCFLQIFNGEVTFSL